MIESISFLAKTIFLANNDDNDCLMGVGGTKGIGKSTFTTKLLKEYCKCLGMKWSFNLMTWSRKELMTWVDGDKKKKPDPETGLREGQLPEYSAILCDELFPMFYSRNWFEDGQKDALTTFNMCRDRHLFICGNVPNFWELDSSLRTSMRFYVYIPVRGVAWVFKQENNPFTKDQWNVEENKKIFRKNKGNPTKCPNYLCTVKYDDWDSKEKEEYYRIRNSKRIHAFDENKPERKERYAHIKSQRDALIDLCYKLNPKLKNKDLAEVIGITKEAISMIRNKIR